MNNAAGHAVGSTREGQQGSLLRGILSVLLIANPVIELGLT